jgi:hypothetical protein
MSILTALRDRVSAHGSSADGSQAEVSDSDYDRLGTRQVIDGLHNRSQVDLEAVEAYERSHQDRAPVLDKLRYMRGPEPFPGFDSLDEEAVLTAIKDVDLVTIKKVRGYERKFANRAAVLEAVLEIQHRLQAAQPATTAPAYQSMGGASV